MEAPDYCFPARLEEIAILEAAVRENPRDARAPYYLGNLLYDRRRHEEAIRLWEHSAKLDPGFSVVWRNLGIGYFNVRRRSAKAKAAYDAAGKAAKEAEAAVAPLKVAMQKADTAYASASKSGSGSAPLPPNACGNSRNTHNSCASVMT